jgi:hypothetical protein
MTHQMTVASIIAKLAEREGLHKPTRARALSKAAEVTPGARVSLRKPNDLAPVTAANYHAGYRDMAQLLCIRQPATGHRDCRAHSSRSMQKSKERM